MKILTRAVLVFALLTLWVVSFAGNLTVTSPTNGDYLGTSNSLTFNISGASVQVTVTAVVTGPSGSTTLTKKFTPDTDGTINGSMSLNFNNSSPEGYYTIVVTATEPNNTYSPTTLSVKVDVVAPKFLEISPNDGQYVRGIVKIRATVKESSIKNWTVQVNGQDIPNNTGTTNDISVDWDTSLVTSDGPQTITIKVTDLAENSATKSQSVTIDRVAPIITISYPRTDTKIVPGTTITILVDVQDASSSSVDSTGVDVIAKRTDGTFICRVARISYKSSGSTTSRWTGRIQYKSGLLPSQFYLVATAIDRAGNSGTPQEVKLTVGRSR